MPPSALPANDHLVRTSSGEQAAHYIRRLIFDGSLRPGARVPQDDIAQTLGISRIPVREALIALEREGWVTIEMHRGVFVNALDAQVVRDHYDLYGLVYGFAAQRALARSLAGLVDALTELEREFSSTADPSRLDVIAYSFHATIVDAAHSPRLKVVLRAMSALVPGSFFSLVPEAIDIERRGMKAVVRAIKRNDGDAVAREYARMMDRVGDAAVRVFEVRGLFEPAI